MTEAIIKKIIAFWSPHMSLFFLIYVYLCTHSNNNNDDNDKMRHVLCLLMCLLKWQKNKNKNPWTVKNIKCESLLSFFPSIYPPKSEKKKKMKMKITSSHSLHTALSVGDMLDWVKRKNKFIDVIKFDEEIFFFLHFNVSAQHGWFLSINNG